MELRQYVGVIRKWLWLIVLSTAVAAGLSWLVVKDQQALYQTSTTLMIGQALDKSDPTYADFYTGERLAQTYSELIRREPILKATAGALGFEDQWRQLREQVGVGLIPGTELLEITVTDTDPQRAKLIADELARQLQARVAPEDTRERQFIREQAASFPAKIEAAQEEVQRLEAEVGEAFSARQIQDIQNQINTLQNQISTWQASFAQYQLLLGEGSVKVLEVIEEAPVPASPIGPNWMLQVVLAGAIGLVLGVGAAFALEYLDDSLRSPDEVSRTMGLTTIGAITRITGSKPSERLITVRHPKSPISEAYRAMRTNLQFSELDQPVKSLVVTSPNPVEGKSTTLANLGVVMAQAGKTVVMVDSDLRRPMLHKIFEVPNSEGLTSVLLEDEIELNGRLVASGIENLWLLTSGPLPPNPSELLGSKKMGRLIEELGRVADVTLFDSPPSLPVTDAMVLATQTDGVLLVTDAGKTRRAAARQAADNLRQVGANILGVVLNRLSPRGSGRYYYNYYYYHYYYYQNGQDGSGRRRNRRRRWLRRIPLLGRLFRR